MLGWQITSELTYLAVGKRARIEPSSPRRSAPFGPILPCIQMTVGSVFGLVGQFIPLGLGLLAEQFRLRTALWLVLAEPVALLVGIPRRRSDVWQKRVCWGEVIKVSLYRHKSD